MGETTIVVRSDGADLPATLTLPAGTVRGGLVPLHPSDGPSREHFLFRHLAQILPPLGIAVLRFDRRPSDRDVPLTTQARDALNAVALLRGQSALAGKPIGLWGFSQGA